jgi:hypothetical protein
MGYDIFRDQLALKYPAYGHALWEPNPWGLYSAVQVGDVGFIGEGKFHRLFNALLPEDHPSHENFGVPEHHKPLKPRIQRHNIFTQVNSVPITFAQRQSSLCLIKMQYYVPQGNQNTTLQLHALNFLLPT